MTRLFPKQDEEKWPRKIEGDRNAKPIAWRMVKRGTPVIYVRHAFLRGSTFSGYFELAQDEESFLKQVNKQEGERRVHVVCYWQGRGLKNEWPSIKLSDHPIVQWDYEGPVIINIGTLEHHTEFCRES